MKRLVKKAYQYNIIRFGIFSGTGLLIDTSIFYFLTRSLLSTFTANCISSFVAVTFVYFTSVRLVFKNKKYCHRKYTYFVLYYFASIIVFSTIINLINIYYIPEPVYAKLVTIPVSFLVNYFFSSKII